MLRVVGRGRIDFLEWLALLQCFAQKPLDALLHSAFCDIAFPNYQYAPSELSQISPSSFIAIDVLCDFGAPITGVGLWSVAASLAAMTVPKAAVDEDGRSNARKNQIRRARQISAM